MEGLIQKFYDAFDRLDAEGMAACYHEDIQFEDPAFGVLEGASAGNMWRMLCASQQGQDFTVKASNIAADEQGGKAHWEAWYNFSRTGRKVHNKIDAQFEFKDGLIIRHTDRFNLYRWSRQALGIQGLLLGWTGFFRKKLQAQTRGMLRKFESKL